MKQHNRLWALALVLATLCLAPAAIWAATGPEIDASVDAALDRFTKEINGADSLLAQAEAVLVMPKVVKGGFIVGGEYGEGALRIAGRTAAYYSIASASFGLTFGGGKKDIILVFLEEGAVTKFRESKGWKAGVDGNIAVIKTGSGVSMDTTKFNEPIVGFVVGVKGLLVDASFNGSKFSLIER